MNRETQRRETVQERYLNSQLPDPVETSRVENRLVFAGSRPHRDWDSDSEYESDIDSLLDAVVTSFPSHFEDGWGTIVQVVPAGELPTSVPNFDLHGSVAHTISNMRRRYVHIGRNDGSFVCQLIIRDPIAFRPSQRDNQDRILGVPSETLQRIPFRKVGSVDAATHLGVCPICLSSYTKNMLVRVISSCGHSIHKPCFDKWILDGQRFTCPLDNRIIQLDQEPFSVPEAPVDRHVSRPLTRSQRIRSRAGGMLTRGLPLRR